MGLQHVYFHLILARQREKELLERARTARLLAEIKADKPGLRARLLTKSGVIFILVGQKLKERYEPEGQPNRHLPFLEGATND